MTEVFDVRHFLTRAPREWLRRYFARAGLLSDFDWQSLPRRKIDALLGRWRELDQFERERCVEDFRNIKLLATPACKMQIIDEAAYFGTEKDVAAKLLDLGDYYACAFWVLLEQPECWEGALRYALADSKSKTYWRKRVNMPSLGRRPTDDDGQRLAKALTQLFTAREARGSRCVVHLYRRGADAKREYFFAYSEDHKHTPLVFDEDGLVTRPHNPAFEVIFVHDDESRTLSIWHQGSKARIKDLQIAFAVAVLNAKIPRDSPRDDRVYDLQKFLDPQFAFSPDPALGIADVELRKLRVRVNCQDGRTIIVALDTNTASNVIHQDLRTLLADVPESQQEVTQVGLRVTFEQMPGQKDQRTRSFQITAPNSCNLKPDEFAPLIERLLTDHGIEPRRRQDFENGPTT